MTFDPTVFISKYVDAPIEYGSDDCGLWLADWWRYCHGVDPASHLRGTYAGEAEKQSIVNRAGSLTILVGSIADSVGAKPVLRHSEIKMGDFGVIAPGVCAIRALDYWAARSDHGILWMQTTRVWRVWSISK